MQPLDAIARRLATGEIDAKEALRQARDPAVVALIDAGILKTLTGTAQHLCRTERSKHAIPLLQVVLAALDAAPAHAVAIEIRDMTELAWVESVAQALWHAPDPRLYRDALARGERVVTSARARGDLVMVGRLLQALGFLHLEPFSRHRSVQHLATLRGDWERRLYEGDTWDGERAPTAQGGPFPEPVDAVRLAEGHLREAVKVCQGQLLAEALSGLLTALDVRGRLGDPAATEDIIAVGRKALVELEKHGDPARIVEVLGRLQSAGVEVDFTVLTRVLAVPFDQIIERYGRSDTVSLLLNVALLMENAGHGADCLRFLEHYGPFLAATAKGELRRAWLTRLRTALREAFSAGYEPPVNVSVKKSFPALQQRVDAEEWDLKRTGAAFLALAERSHETDEELFGIPLLTRLDEMEPFSRHPLALHSLRGLLWWSAASRLAPLESDQALACYGQALSDAAEVEDPVVAGAVLNEIREAVASANAPGLAAIVATLTRVARRLELLLGESGTKRIQEIAGATSLRLVHKVRDAAVMHDVLRLAKGLRFGAMLSTRAGPRYIADAQATAMQARIDSLLRAAVHQAASARLDTLGEMLLVSPQIEDGVRLSGESDNEMLANLQHRFDRHLDRALTLMASDAHVRDVGAAALADFFDDRTVLLDYFLTNAGDAEVIVRFLRARDGVALGATQLGKETAQRTLVFDGMASELSETAARVLALRKAVNEDPDSGALSENAAIRLERDAELLLGDLPPLLQDLHASGKRHLCIVTHGALHVAPLHLLLVDGRPLAEDWIVTYLPNMFLVARSTEDQSAPPPPARDRTLTAIGVSFTRQNPHNLAPLENVAAEVRAIASTLDGVTLLDDQATESAILGALENSRYVHIATHGAHNRFAASFQCLYCAPGDGGDGRLFAHELTGRDLRGLELVTLSACETALGRFDFGDNLLGLPAMLFLAGARTIIGTLWDLETNAAETFFTALYAALDRGAEKREAFAEAQRTTRKSHPEFRDWGAFYFAGDWR